MFNVYISKLVLRIFCFDKTEVSEQPKCVISSLNAMAIRDQRQANVSKQSTIIVGIDVAPP